jgi:hypothetical protein
MVRRRACAVSNHEARDLSLILRDAREGALLRIRSSTLAIRSDRTDIALRAVAAFRERQERT